MQQVMPNESNALPWWQRRWIWPAATVVVALPFAAWGVVVAMSPGSFDLRGRMELFDGVTQAADSGQCSGYRGYDDIADGTQVTVYSSSGEALATGSLAGASYWEATNVCTFRFVIIDVPGGHNMYQVEVSHRGKVAVREADARAGNVIVSLG